MMSGMVLSSGMRFSNRSSADYLPISVRRQLRISCQAANAVGKGKAKLSAGYEVTVV